MNVEIVDFYPCIAIKKHSVIVGTIHVYLKDFDIDLRGIRVINLKNRYSIQLRCDCTTDTEDGSKVRYPIFSFQNKETGKDLMDSIRDELNIFFPKWCAKNQFNPDLKGVKGLDPMLKFDPKLSRSYVAKS